MYYNINLSQAFASQFATELTKVSIWNCLLSTNGKVSGVKFRCDEDKKPQIRKIYNKIAKKTVAGSHTTKNR